MSIRDLRQAFPSTSCDRVRTALFEAGLLPDAESLVRRLVTVRGSLPQGAPTSNAILDLVLTNVDTELQRLADTHGARYTRFADDLTFSSFGPLDGMMPLVDATIEAAGFSINQEKSKNYLENDVKLVTGLVIGTSLSLPPDFVTETEWLISEAHRGDWQANRLQLSGRVEWISSFDASRGAILRKALRRIRNRGGRRPAKQARILRFRVGRSR